MHDKPIRRLPATLPATLLATLLLAIACSPAASPSPAPTEEPGWVPQTAWEHALDGIGEDGLFSKDAALRLFATAYGPLPGVDVPQDLTGVFSRTIAIRAIDRHRDALTQEQRDAIDRYLTPPAGAVDIVIPPVAAMGPVRLASTDGAAALIAQRAALLSGPVALADPATEQAIRDVGEMSRTIIASKLGRDFLGDHTFSFVPRPSDVQAIDGQYPNGGTQGIYEGGVYSSCRTVIYNEATSQSAVQLAALIAHETFHCFQGDGYRLIPPWNMAPHWVSEGQATWVGLEVGGPSPNYNRFWKKYLAEPRIDLRTRAYDAVGFYAHLAETGTDPWTIFEAQWAAGTDHFAIFTAAGADNEEFLDSWASSVIRDGGRGAAWDTTGPAITSDRYAPPSFAVAGGSQVDLSAAFFTNDVRALSVQADLLEIRAEGHLRLNDGVQDIVLHEDAMYCVQGHDCTKVCPGGEPPPETDGTIGSQVLVATSGSHDGSLGTARGIDLDTCESPPPSDDPAPEDRDPCQTKCGQSNGDVHIATFGEFGYDFQGVGEFILARSEDGRFEVQGRLAAPEGRSTVSINVAVAVRIGDHRVGVYLDQLGSPLRATVDGQPAATTGSTRVGASGLLTPYPRGLRIDSGDGSHVYVVGDGRTGFNLLVEPGEARLAGIVGLMGPNGENSRYPLLRDGTTLPFTTDRHEDYQQLYVQLADSWRITPAESLFDYAAGTSTETFTIRSFPAEEDLVYLDLLSPAQLAAGEEACRSITDEALHKMCIYDVGVTADSGYGDLYEHTVTLLETGSLGASGERVRVVNLYANEGRGTALDIYAWAGDATSFGTNPGTGPALIATVPYGEASAWFNPGQMSNGPFAPVNWITAQRAGEPIAGWHFNLFDLPGDSTIGLDRVIVITADGSDQFSPVGGTAASYNVIREEAPEGYFPLVDAPPGKALGFLNPIGMYQLRQDQHWVASVDGRCLTSPEFPTLATVVQGTSPRELVLEPGSREVAVHAFPAGGDNFDLDCRRFPVEARANVSVGDGDRVHLIVHAENPDAPVQLLAVPVGG